MKEILDKCCKKEKPCHSSNEQISCCGINEIIQSVALEQTAIAHILNAEGEKLQKILQGCHTVEEILCVNKSVSGTIEDITFLEVVLLNKLKSVVNVPCCKESECGCGSFVIFIHCCESNRPIAGICVKIIDCKDNIVCSGETNHEGIFSVDKLPFGVYKVILKDEISCEERTFEFHLSCKCPSVSVSECFRCRELGAVCLTVKSCCNGAPLKGILVTLCDCHQKIIDEGITNTCGIYEKFNLPDGHYCLKIESKCGEIKKICFEICNHEKVCLTDCLNDKEKEVTICGIVVDACQKPLANAQVQAKGINSKAVSTNCDGIYNITNLKVCDKFSVFACCGNLVSPTHTCNMITKKNCSVNFILK